MSEEDVSDLLTTEKAAKHLDLSFHTLTKWRRQKRGPKYTRLGPRAIRYHKSDLDAFIKQGEQS